jgi:glutamate synthase (NADPH/NADH) large chain
VLGRTGRNFAAGMSGGVAYVFDANGEFARRCNREMVDLETLVDGDEISWLQDLIMKHVALTGSTYVEGLLKDWAGLQSRIVKVMPREYKRVMAEQARREREAAHVPSSAAPPAIPVAVVAKSAH